MDTNNNKVLVDFIESNFVSTQVMAQSPELANEKFISQTVHAKVNDLIIPSIYFEDSDYVKWTAPKAIPGTMLTLLSFSTKFIFCIESFPSPLEKDYEKTPGLYYPFLILDRDKIQSFTWQENHGFRAVKPKFMHTFASRFPKIAMGFIPLLLLRTTYQIAENIEADTIERKGTKFTLTFTDNGNSHFISLSCEDMLTYDLETFLKINWVNKHPVIPKTPTTKEEKKKYIFESLAIGDKVKISKFFSVDYGHVISKSDEFATIKIIHPNGNIKTENIEYLKLQKTRGSY